MIFKLCKHLITADKIKVDQFNLNTENLETQYEYGGSDVSMWGLKDSERICLGIDGDTILIDSIDDHIDYDGCECIISTKEGKTKYVITAYEMLLKEV